MRKRRARRLVASVTAAMFAGSLIVAASASAAAADADITPGSRTLVNITNGSWADIVLCANPDDLYVRVGRDANNPYCQWEQIGNDSRFTFFNPAKGMVLGGDARGMPLVMAELAYPDTAAQNFAWGPARDGGSRALQWYADQKQNVDAGNGDTPADGPVVLADGNGLAQQTWNVAKAGNPAAPQVAKSAAAVFVTSNMWTNQVLCAAADGTVRLSANTQDRACEWLPFGPQNGPFVLYNPQYGKVITYDGGPLRVGDLTYPSDDRELWAFSTDKYFGAKALRWAGDATQNVDAGATSPTTAPVRTRSWDSGNQQSMTWKFLTVGAPTATVTLGDSFMSGEAGRWQGNSNYALQSRDGTDRAYLGWERYDPSIVYGSSYQNGCNRSDSAEAHSSDVNDVQINLACSGAKTVNIFRSGNGGEPYKGEAPQADQLLAVAKQYDVRLIALSIGGNDLGFSSIIKACVTAYTLGNPPCYDEQQKIVLPKLGPTLKNVVKAITEIQATMTTAGYQPGHYRIVLQSAPSPIPLSKDIRYQEGTWERWHTGGCPFWNADADWARGKLVGEISSLLKQAATNAGVGFLDLQDAFNGREVCSVSSRLVTSKTPPNPVSSEWARFLVTGAVQGQTQESFHPGFYGQRAMGRCLALYAALGQNATCRNTPGTGPEGMFVERI